MNLEQLEQKLRGALEKLPLLRKIESELRGGYDLIVNDRTGIIIVAGIAESELSPSSEHISDLTEDSFAEYRVPPFHFKGVTAHEGVALESTGLSEAERELCNSMFDTVDLTIKGRTYEFRRGHTYIIDGDMYPSDRRPCYAACRVVRTLRKEGSVKFADLGHIDSIEKEAIEL